jgi:hypothetical protein
MTEALLTLGFLAVVLGAYLALIYCAGERISGVNEPGYKDKSKDDHGN